MWSEILENAESNDWVDRELFDGAFETGMWEFLSYGVRGAFDVLTMCFNFLLDTPILAFMICIGFAFAGTDLIRRALRTVKM